MKPRPNFFPMRIPFPLLAVKKNAAAPTAPSREYVHTSVRFCPFTSNDGLGDLVINIVITAVSGGKQL